MAGVASPSADEPLDQVVTYTNRLTGQGQPLEGYFYMGFVHGVPYQAVQLGFNGRQSTSRSQGFFTGGEFPEPGVNADPYGLRYYSLGWAATSLADYARNIRNRAEAGRNVSHAERKLLELKPALDAKGQPRNRGRANLNLFDPLTVDLIHSYAENHVNKWSADVAGRATGDRIHLWGLDNEWEGEGGPDYSPEARAAFALWLDKQYDGDIRGLNEAWDADYKDFAAAAQGDLPAAADYKTKPGAFLDLWTFQSRHFVETLAGQAQRMHDADPLGRGVVHKSTQQTIEMPGVNRNHLFDHDRFAELMRPISGGLYGTDMYGSGDRQAYELNYLYNVIRPLDNAPGYGIFLPETNNHSGPGHAFGTVTWRMLANGLKAVDFFTLGFAGAGGDWNTFGFIDNKTGLPKDKLFYAGRWASMVHRTEAFWRQSVPAEGMPRVALLLPRRDVLLSDLSDRSSSRWGYARNHRWMVFRWLREQGYWVDVIPYAKLDEQWLKQYEALFLIGANHLTQAEAVTIANYVSEGGALVADSLAGHYDEHHRVRRSLEPVLGVSLEPDGSTKKSMISFDGHSLEAHRGVAVSPSKSGVQPAAQSGGKSGALAAAQSGGKPRTLTADAYGKPLGTLSTYGKGQAAHLAMELGSTQHRKPSGALSSFIPEGPTADAEEYAFDPDQLSVGNWLRTVLRELDLQPSYTADARLGGTGNLRVEQPFADAHGNLAVVVTTRGDSDLKTLPAGSVTLPIDAASWGAEALWAAAENNELLPVALSAGQGGKLEVALPAIRTAGVLYLTRGHRPLLGIKTLEGAQQQSGTHTPKMALGKPFEVTVQVRNPSADDFGAGSLTLLAPSQWSVQPQSVDVPALKAGGHLEFVFTVSLPEDAGLLRPEWIYPLVATWNTEDGSLPTRSIVTAHVQADVASQPTLRLLSGNATYPESYPEQIVTGMSYRYLEPAAVRDPANAAAGAVNPSALTSGFSSARIGFHRSSAGERKHYATVNAQSADIEFDLKKNYEVRQAVVAFGPSGPLPQRVQVLGLVSGLWETLAEHTFGDEPSIEEYRSDLFRAKTDKIRVRIEWPAAGGTVDEVELWGN